MSAFRCDLADEAATCALATCLAAVSPHALVVYLAGNLGAGKTVFARCFLKAMGVGERVKSPTYSLVEGYRLPHGSAFHLDLYRIADPSELEWLGLDALAEPDTIVLVEWPDRGRGALPLPDLTVRMATSETGRTAMIDAASDIGCTVLRQMSIAWTNR